MRAVVTGATGYVGRRLVQELLNLNYEVLALSRRPPGPEDDTRATWVQVDLGMPLDAREAGLLDGSDVLFNCAGQIRSESEMYQANVHSTANLVHAGWGRVGRWVQLSSIGVYGFQNAAIVDEQAPIRPRGSYEMSKAAAEAIVNSAAKRGAFNAIVLRPSSVIGKGMPAGFLRQMTRAVERGVFFFVGDKKAVANYVSLEDLVDALIRCSEGNCRECNVFNVNEPITYENVVREICSETGRGMPRIVVAESFARAMSRALSVVPSSPLTAPRVAALVNKTVYEARAIREDLGWRPTFGVAASVREVAATVTHK